MDNQSAKKTLAPKAADQTAGTDASANNNRRHSGPRGAERSGSGRGAGPRGRQRDAVAQDSEFEQKIIDLARVTRVMAGGKRMRFRACVAIGNGKGRVGLGLAKGADVTMAITKAVNQAKKNMLDVPLANDTIPHEIRQKFGSSLILLKPGRKGQGIICGSVVRMIAELAGIHNISSKILGTNNNVSNAKCVMLALSSLKVKKPKAIKVPVAEVAEAV